MKTTKKILSVFIAILMLTSIFAVSASAAATKLDGGNSMSTATNIPSFEKSYASSLDTKNETDWFKFTTNSSEAYYYFEFTNNSIPALGGYNSVDTSPCFTIYDLNMKQIALLYSWKIGACSKTNIKLETSETYYIKVNMGYYETDNTGMYEIKISYINDEIPNEMSRAKNINFNKEYIQSLDGKNDIDWFKIHTGSKSAEYDIYLKNINISSGTNRSEDCSVNLWIYTKNNESVKHIYAFLENEEITSKVTLSADSDYYIAVTTGKYISNSTGNYKFSLSSGGQINPDPDPNPDPDLTPSFLDRIIDFFITIWNWIISLFA